MEPPPASRKAPKPLVLLFTQHTLTASWDAEAQRTPSEGACSQTELQRQRGRLERLAGRPSAASPPPRRTHIWTSVLEGKCQAGPEAGARAPPGLLARRPLRCCCRGLPAALPGRCHARSHHLSRPDGSWRVCLLLAQGLLLSVSWAVPSPGTPPSVLQAPHTSSSPSWAQPRSHGTSSPTGPVTSPTNSVPVELSEN